MEMPMRTHASPEGRALAAYLRRPLRRRLARVVHLLHGPVWRVAARVAGNREDAHDIRQEVFLSLLLAPPAAGWAVT